LSVTGETSTTTLKVATYALTVGAASAINQDVQTTAGPTFAGLTLSGAEPDIILDDTGAAGYTTLTFREAGVDRFALGKTSAGNFYLTVYYGAAWHTAFTVDATNMNANFGANVGYDGALISNKNATNYTVYGFVPLTTYLTSTSFDGDSFSDTAKTLIDLSAVFGAPAGIKAALVRVMARDSGSAANASCLVCLGHNNSSGVGQVLWLSGIANDMWHDAQMIVPCDANGDIYYQVDASGAGTLDLYIQIWGYWI
jgi:hypothetical protein